MLTSELADGGSSVLAMADGRSSSSWLGRPLTESRATCGLGGWMDLMAKLGVDQKREVRRESLDVHVVFLGDAGARRDNRSWPGLVGI